MQRSLFVLLISVVVVVACKDDPEPNNGVNDVKAACEIRAQWSKRSTQECSDCLTTSRAPDCDCPAFPQDFVGKCSEQGTAFGNERNCDFVGDCAAKCALTDCGCIEACYADRAACKPKAAAVDGCTTDVCDKYCR